MAKADKPWLPPKEGGYRARTRSASTGKSKASRNTGGSWSKKASTSGRYLKEPAPPRGGAAVSRRKESNG